MDKKSLKIEKVIELLSTLYSSWEGTIYEDCHTPFEFLVATILSQRTKDLVTIESIRNLFARYRTPQELNNAKLGEIEKCIKKVGFFRKKARVVKAIAKILSKNYQSYVLEDRDFLLSLPGVGPKTANCVLVYAFAKPAIPVDTHVNRIVHRLKWVKTKHPKKTERELQKIIPQKHWSKINPLLVRFGQEICRPTKPRCEECGLGNQKLCPFKPHSEAR